MGREGSYKYSPHSMPHLTKQTWQGTLSILIESTTSWHRCASSSVSASQWCGFGPPTWFLACYPVVWLWASHMIFSLLSSHWVVWLWGSHMKSLHGVTGSSLFFAKLSGTGKRSSTRDMIACIGFAKTMMWCNASHYNIKLRGVTL